MIERIKIFYSELKEFRKEINALPSNTVSRKDLREKAESLGSLWCNDFLSALQSSESFSAELLEPYNQNFKKLIALSSPNNRKINYLNSLNIVLKKFRSDFILPLQGGSAKILPSVKNSIFSEFLSEIAPSDDGKYFSEAISCAANGFYRAAVVMGWCTAIDKIHMKIESLGFAKFNVTSSLMASQKTGRFKRFNKVFNIASTSDLREVFDTDSLWILEGMMVIDLNQHTRLRSCFEMRNQSAHPGEAPITSYNLMSFFSDIQQIILVNPKFSI